MRSYYVLLFILPAVAFGQSDSTRKYRLQAFAEAGVSVSTSARTPFWLRAKQYGTVPNQGSFGQLRNGISMDYGHKKSKADWGFGVEVVVNAGRTSEVVLPEMYVKGRLGVFELVAGRRRKVVGLADTLLGIGPMAWSGNALPIPEIQISMPNYVPIGFTKGLLSIKGFYSHGWFDNRGPVKGSFLHQKALYGRFGKPNWALKLYGGFNHEVQWGGRTDIFTTTNNGIKDGQFPNRFPDYIDVVLARRLSLQNDIDTNRISRVDRENRIGNHLGTIDFGAEWTGEKFSLLVYRQGYYEAGALFYLKNIADGLNGIRFQRLVPQSRGLHIKKIVAEFLYTLSQGGLNKSPANLSGGPENYFNHTQYVDGWSYEGRGIGTPFISNYSETRPDLPPAVKVSNTNGTYRLFTNNNRVRVLHIGLDGMIGTRYSFKLLCSLSDNQGTYAIAFPANTVQLSSLLAVSAPLAGKPDWLASVKVAVDQGKLLQNTTGVYVSLRKVWGVKPIRSDRSRLAASVQEPR